jgi:ADP-ribosylglycohydrolase
VQHYVPQEAERTALEASALWYSGAYLLETVPTVLHILMRHAGDPEEAIIRAVNDTKDNDTIAAIVGAAVGALHGCARLPDRWKRGLLGRTQKSDDGRICELIDESIRRFGCATGSVARSGKQDS